MLLVEDDPDTLDVFAEILRDRGVRVRPAGNGYEALLEFDRLGADVVVTDLHMPAMDGIDLLRAIKRRDSSVEVIVLTGDSSVHAAIAAMRGDGAFDFLIKPLRDVEQLTEIVEQAASRRSEAQSLSHDLRRAEHVRSVALALTGPGDVETRIGGAVWEACGAFGVTGSTVYLVDDRNDWAAALSVASTTSRWLSRPVPRHRTVAEAVLRQVQPWFAPHGVLPLTGQPSAPVAALPLRAGSRTIGVWALEGDPGRRIRDEDKIWLQRLADHVALALDGALERQQHARRAEEALRLAMTDPLTGLSNRRGFDELLDRQLDEARATGMPCALLLLDLDDLKGFNDRHGHRVGDLALRAVAHALAKTARLGDVAARVGGDEFAVICPCADLDGARTLAARIRVALARTGPPIPGRRVEVSIGVASFPRDADAADALFAVADGRMYSDKRAEDSGDVSRIEVSGRAAPAALESRG